MDALTETAAQDARDLAPEIAEHLLGDPEPITDLRLLRAVLERWPAASRLEVYRGYDIAISAAEHDWEIGKRVLEGALHGLELAGESLPAQARQCGGYQ